MPTDLFRPAAAACCSPTVAEIATASGSRRRRIWEPAPHAHCPVIGVRLPMPALRRRVDKVLVGQVQGDDYPVHSGGPYLRPA